MTENNQEHFLNDIFDYTDQIMHDDNFKVNDLLIQAQMKAGQDNNNSIKNQEQFCDPSAAENEVIYISDNSLSEVNNSAINKRCTHDNNDPINDKDIDIDMRKDNDDLVNINKKKKKKQKKNDNSNSNEQLKHGSPSNDPKLNKSVELLKRPVGKLSKDKSKDKDKKDIYASIQKELADISYPLRTDIKIEKLKTNKKATTKNKEKDKVKEKEKERVNPTISSIETVDLSSMTKELEKYYKKTNQTKKLNKILEVSKQYDPSKDLLTNYSNIFNKKNNLTIQTFQTGFEYYATLYFQLLSKITNEPNKTISLIMENESNSTLSPVLASMNKKEERSSRNSADKHEKTPIKEKQNKSPHKTAAKNEQKSVKKNETIESEAKSKEPETKKKKEPKNQYNKKNTDKSDLQNKEKPLEVRNINNEPPENISSQNESLGISFTKDIKKDHSQSKQAYEEINLKKKDLWEEDNFINNENNQPIPTICSEGLKTKSEIDELMEKDPIYAIIKESIHNIDTNRDSIDYLELALPNEKMEFIQQIRNGLIENYDKELTIELYKHDYFVADLVYKDNVFSINEKYLNFKE